MSEKNEFLYFCEFEFRAVWKVNSKGGVATIFFPASEWGEKKYMSDESGGEKSCLKLMSKENI